MVTAIYGEYAFSANIFSNESLFITVVTKIIRTISKENILKYSSYLYKSLRFVRYERNHVSIKDISQCLNG